ncbi:mitochondrial dicarboxylate carrier [Verticillium alfalfae VaMs.102]|uniref:Mitochondrial dicarboxylate carrier n=1 Tax=Verticillium alfalfae (strain VaMs.102 / ATCC MYA-4576 / FGSC 10136) TaxID=526221 RepID=C9SWY4_VERA1|nr:mitochondrial dicarboxylate carrier [Verticillium alfalfae VaMs.102]EEY23525.1 mitochondrial dicarboxylate carrier [Verticillium alfalfae VaMs.102]
MSSSTKQNEPFWLGGAAASMAVCFTHPLDQTKYRMQVLKSRNSMFRAMYRFASRDDVGQIATYVLSYSTAKHYLLASGGLKDDVRTHTLASFLAGTVATTICAPADVLKSRIQSASAAGSGGNSVVQIIRTSLREEGPRFLMKGWTPAWLRLTPNTILTFVFMEQLRILTQWTFVPAGGATMKI